MRLRLSRFNSSAPLEELPKAAVLVCLFEPAPAEEMEILLTRRSGTLSHHAGEVSFPGGWLEPGETPEAAALREAEEEVGLQLPGTCVLGRFPVLDATPRRVSIMPVLALSHGRPRLELNSSEVEEALRVPLSELVAEGVYWRETWPSDVGVGRDVHFFELEGDTVWGATARVLVELLEALVVP